MNNRLRIIILTIGLSVNLTMRSQTYEFFQTRNYHNQLRLNTKTGEVYQVQDDGGSWIVNNAFTPESTTPYRYGFIQLKICGPLFSLICLQVNFGKHNIA